jgi:hypothetical protein
MDFLATTRKHNRSTGKDGLLPGCRVKDPVLAVAGDNHTVMDITTAVFKAGVGHVVPSDEVSVSDQAWVEESLMNFSPCALRLRKLHAFL